MIDSIFQGGQNCYPQIYFEECKCNLKNKRWRHSLMIMWKLLLDGDEIDDDDNSGNTAQKIKFSIKDIFSKLLQETEDLVTCTE